MEDLPRPPSYASFYEARERVFNEKGRDGERPLYAGAEFNDTASVALQIVKNTLSGLVADLLKENPPPTEKPGPKPGM
jgi:hypothetical protein